LYKIDRYYFLENSSFLNLFKIQSLYTATFFKKHIEIRMSLLAQEKLGQIDLIELGASFDWIHLRTFPHRLKKEARLLVCK